VDENESITTGLPCAARTAFKAATLTPTVPTAELMSFALPSAIGPVIELPPTLTSTIRSARAGKRLIVAIDRSR
jgi:hypothetical protein